MVAKSEASMPMSRALAKLAVATDLGTAARPSTSALVFTSSSAAASHAVGSGSGGGKTGLNPAGHHSVGPGGSNGKNGLATASHAAGGSNGKNGLATASHAVGGSNGKNGLTTAGHGSAAGSNGKSGLATANSSARSLLLKPCATRAVLAAMPLAALDNALSAAAPAAPPPLPPGQQEQQQPHPPTTPRLPPLSPSGGGNPGAARRSSDGGVIAGGRTSVVTDFRSQPLPKACPDDRQGPRGAAPRSSPAGPSQSHPHPHPQHQQHHSPARQPLPLLSHPAPAASHGCSDFGRELLDAAKNHPGLPASLLAQLHRSRGRGGGPAVAAAAAAAPASAPSGANARALGTAYSAPPVATSYAAARVSGAGTERAPGTAAAPGGAAIRPLSPRARARATATLTAAAPAAAPPAAAVAAAPPPAAMASLSPEALAVLLGPAPTGPPPGTASGLLVMRRSAPVVNGAGAPLRPSTSAGLAAASAAASEAPVVPQKPHVVPHITVPYKPGSIRLPPGAVIPANGTTSATAASYDTAFGSRPGTAASASANAGGLVPSAAQPRLADPASAAAAAGRPWTSASGSRPTTANPLTHSMEPDPTASLVVRLPRSKTAAVLAAAAGPGPRAPHPQPPPSAAPAAPTGGVGAAAAAVAGVGRGTSSSTGVGDGCNDGGAGAGGGSGPLAPARKLTDEELRAVVAAVAAARPEAAALLRQRPATAEASSRPGTAGGGRRPPTAGPAAGDAIRRSGSYTSAGVGADGAAAAAGASSRPSSRGGSRGGTASRVGTAAYDDVWPAPQSPRTPGGSRDTALDGFTGGAASAPGTGGSRAPSSSGRPAVISAWGSTRRKPLQSIPEDAEFQGEDGEGEDEAGELGFGLGAGTAAAAVAAAGGMGLVPLEPLDPDPDLDSAWASIVAANLRPDTAAVKAATGSIDVFSRPVTGAPRVARQAAPMVLVLEDLTASTPEVLERELAQMSLQELQSLQSRLNG